MTEHKHTPAPWKPRWEKMTMDKGMGTFASHGAGPLIVYPENRAREAEAQAVADSHLIAAAPDLIEALEAVVNLYDEYDNAEQDHFCSGVKQGYSDAAELAQAALAKAKGES